MHSALGHRFPIRATSDTDIGIAIDHWAIIDRIHRRYRRLGSNGIRYLVGEFPVDIMPFGGIENPQGIARPSSREEDLVVFGFSDVYSRASRLTLRPDLTVRIPHPAGYGALKLRSWIDRSVYGEDKGARDLAVVAYWYQESPDVQDRIFDMSGRGDLLEQYEWDTGLAAAHLMGTDMAGQLSPASRHDLADRWETRDIEALVRSFLLPSGLMGSSNGRRRERIACIRTGFRRGAGIEAGGAGSL